MECPQCGLVNPPDVSACTKCKTPLPAEESGVTSLSAGGLVPEDADQTLSGGTALGSSPRSAAGVRRARFSEGNLQAGTLLADAYEILQRLWEGGVGADYKDASPEIDRFATG